MSDLELRRLNLIFLPLRSTPPEYASQYKAMIECWEAVWGALFQNHQVNQPLYLDQLFRQDEAACVFSGDRCAALILFRTYDFNVIDFRRDSYFKEWEPEDLNKLLAHGRRVFATTYLTVHPDYRSFSDEFKFKELLLNIMIKRFNASHADVISGVTRRDRGIHDESYKLGAEVVHENVSYMGDRFKVDLVAFYKKAAKESSNPAVKTLTNRLWDSRIEATKELTKNLIKTA